MAHRVSAEELMCVGRNRALGAQAGLQCRVLYGEVQDELSYGPDLGYVGRADYDVLCNAVNQLNHDINSSLGDDQPAVQGIPQKNPAWTTKSLAHIDKNLIRTWETRLESLLANARQLMDELGNEHYLAADDN